MHCDLMFQWRWLTVRYFGLSSSVFAISFMKNFVYVCAFDCLADAFIILQCKNKSV